MSENAEQALPKLMIPTRAERRSSALNLEAIGGSITRLIERSGKPLEQIADEVTYSKSAVHNVALAKAYPSLTMLALLAVSLDTTVDALLGIERAPSAAPPSNGAKVVDNAQVKAIAEDVRSLLESLDRVQFLFTDTDRRLQEVRRAIDVSRKIMAFLRGLMVPPEGGAS